MTCEGDNDITKMKRVTFLWVTVYVLCNIWNKKRKISHRQQGPLHGSSSTFLALWADDV